MNFASAYSSDVYDNTIFIPLHIKRCNVIFRLSYRKHVEIFLWDLKGLDTGMMNFAIRGISTYVKGHHQVCYTIYLSSCKYERGITT